MRAVAKHAQRRSVREQLAPPGAPAQRLVWLAGEAVCAVPEIASDWLRPAVAAPFYGGASGKFALRFAGRDAVLVRGSSFAPLGRLRAWLRARPWRSPGVTIGRVLFHLERHDVPAGRLFAFGQRFTGPASAEWFALYESRGLALRDWLRAATEAQRRELMPALRECVAKLHAASCVLLDSQAAFAVALTSPLEGEVAAFAECGGCGVRHYAGTGSAHPPPALTASQSAATSPSRGEVRNCAAQRWAVLIADPRAVRIVRRVSAVARRRDLSAVARLLGME
jgi:hypothetical protein